MIVAGQPRRTIWPAADANAVYIIDQRSLPHHWLELRLTDIAEVHAAIRSMAVRGAPLIGATAAYGLALQCRHQATDAALQSAKAFLDGARPTAVNLAWATQRVLDRLAPIPIDERCDAAWGLAAAIADEDVATNEAIGEHGLALLRELAAKKPAGTPLQVLTHCNAGWLATVDWGTALAPVYKAHAAGLPVHVWVDETRPRNQGASLTAWELGQQGVPFTLIADNAGGHLMQRGEVDIVLVGADRVAANGDVCNKIGTYLKALAAHDNGVPFHVAMPWSTFDGTLADGVAGMPIEHRDGRELTHVSGLDAKGELIEVQLAPAGCTAANPAFDVTPARLVSGLITERGRCAAEGAALRKLSAAA